MTATNFLRQVAEALQCDLRRAEGLTFAVFQELRRRLTPKERSDVAAQLPTEIKRLWEHTPATTDGVEKLHRDEFVGRVRRWAGLPDDGEAERAVRVIFGALQRVLGSASGLDGESWDVFSQLPKDLKRLWVAASQPTARPEV